MREFRVDYVLTDGSRGIWHHEREGSLEELRSQCQREFVHIANQIGNRSENGLSLHELIVVEIMELDVARVLLR